jgi:sulfide dehydrogenase cytochrome subunit
MNRSIMAVALAAVLLPAGASAQSAGPSGEALARTCFICHGPDGRSAGPIPPLAGLPSEHIAKQMSAFKADKLPATIMNRIAKGYSDEQIARIADFFAAVK